MHRFPADLKLKEQWAKRVSRVGWSPTAGSFLCSVSKLFLVYRADKMTRKANAKSLG